MICSQIKYYRKTSPLSGPGFVEPSFRDKMVNYRNKVIPLVKERSGVKQLDILPLLQWLSDMITD